MCKCVSPPPLQLPGKDMINVTTLGANFACLGYLMMDPNNLGAGVMALSGTTVLAVRTQPSTLNPTP